MSLPPKVNYLNNRDLLSAIHESKNTFCEYTDSKYSNYDIITGNLSSVTPEIIEAARHKKLANIIADNKREHGKLYETTLTIDDIFPQDIVVRLMTYDHIPLNPDRKAKVKNVSENHIRCNFPPFQHWIFENGAWRLVGRSHWKNGEFSLVGGRVTNKLGKMWMMLAEKYSQRGNFRGYSYRTELVGQSLMQLAQVGISFDESRSNNPFGWTTQVIHTAFIKVLNNEKKSHSIRDSLLIMHGAMPSTSRQVANQMEQNEAGVVAEPVTIVDVSSIPNSEAEDDV